MFKRIISLLVIVSFILSYYQPVYAQLASPSGGEFRLPAPGVMVGLSPAYSPAVLKGIKLDPQNPFRFHFFVDRGDTPTRGQVLPTRGQVPPTRGHVAEAPIGDRNVSRAPASVRQEDPSNLPSNEALNAKAPQGDNQTQNDNELRTEATRLIKYFLASLTIPEKDLWVNLSPYEKDRIVPQEFGQTEMGRDLLAEDYLLKQITASLIYPESQLGKEFWQKVYAQAQAKYGTTNIPINTFNKVWIVPEKAVVYENGGTAFVLENHLKVMLEQDYLALEKNQTPTRGHVAEAPIGDRNVSRAPASVRQEDPSNLPSNEALNAKAPQVNNGSTSENINALGSQIVREIVIPALTREVNEGKNFAQLRQVFYSLILATWYKKKIKDSILNKVYSNRKRIMGLSPTRGQVPPTRGHVAEAPIGDRNVSRAPASVRQEDPSRLPSNEGLNVEATQRNEPNDVEHIYQQYLKAFKKGVYNYIKEDSVIARSPQGDEAISERTTIPRKYFSGGVTAFINTVMTVVNRHTADSALIAELSQKPQSLMDIVGDMAMISQTPKVSAGRVMTQGHSKVRARKNLLPPVLQAIHGKRVWDKSGRELRIEVLPMRILNPVYDKYTFVIRVNALERPRHVTWRLYGMSSEILFGEKYGGPKTVGIMELTYQSFRGIPDITRKNTDFWPVAGLGVYPAVIKLLADACPLGTKIHLFNVKEEKTLKLYREDKSVMDGPISRPFKENGFELESISGPIIFEINLIKRNGPAPTKTILSREDKHLGGIDMNPAQKGRPEVSRPTKLGASIEGMDEAMLTELSQEDAAAAFEQIKARLRSKPHPVVLIVDDDRTERDLLKANISQRNPNIVFVEAVDGVQALEIIQKRKDEIDLTLSDNDMPRMNGRELFEELHRKSINIDFVLRSGRLEENKNYEGGFFERSKSTDIEQFMDDFIPDAAMLGEKFKSKQEYLYRPFGKTGLIFNLLGFGGAWTSRRWPPWRIDFPDKPKLRWVRPNREEVFKVYEEAFRLLSNKDGIVLLDSAPAYDDGEVEGGSNEQLVGDFLKAHPDLYKRAFITTKDGEDFVKPVAPGEMPRGNLFHTPLHLKEGLKRSAQRLGGRIDLLWIHFASREVLGDKAYMNAFKETREHHEYGIKYLGASFQTVDDLERAYDYQRNELMQMDAIQMKASVLYGTRPEIINDIHERGIAIFINSIGREALTNKFDVSSGRDFRGSYLKVAADPRVSMILIGSHEHTAATLNYFIQEAITLPDSAMMSTLARNSKILTTPTTRKLEKGGIDLNPAQMSMQVKKDGQDFKFNFNGTEIDAAQVTGATFTIRTMTPVTNLQEILGISR